MESMIASKQWATRPVDERFWNPKEAAIAARQFQEMSREKTYTWGELDIKYGANDSLALVGPAGTGATLTYGAARQLHTKLSVPFAFNSKLPIDLALQNLKWGKENNTKADDKSKLLIHRNGGLEVMALTGPDYMRMWDGPILERMAELNAGGWKVPPARPGTADPDPRTRPATLQDLIVGNEGGVQVQVGDPIAPAGVYWGQGTPALFCLLVNPEKVVKAGSNDYLFRGVIVTNDYKGEAAWWIKMFLLRGICGNHILWGMENLVSVRITHRGDTALDRMHHTLEAAVTKIMDESASKDEERIAKAQKFLIAGTQDEVLDTLFGKRIASRKVLEAAWVEAQGPQEQDARTAWGFAQGLTSISQRSGFADERHEIDMAASKVLDFAI